MTQALYAHMNNKTNKQKNKTGLVRVQHSSQKEQHEGLGKDSGMGGGGQR
jgi:hypothetical protein